MIWTVTDLFCGAGGTTTGLENAVFGDHKVCKVVQAVNHDPLAIASHEANHPDTHHFIEDIRYLDTGRLIQTDILWASLECTNFSNAKGGKPRDADSRSLADFMPAYIEAIQPKYFLVENVREFMAWGPLCEKGKPVSRKKGRDYLRWVQTICDMGYHYDYRLMNAADYGARTSRLRYFGCFAKEEYPIRFPEPTHSKGGKTVGTAPWLPVRPLLELDAPSETIFLPRSKTGKMLEEKTYARILAGLEKFCLCGPVITQLRGASQDYCNAPTDGPARTITTQAEWALLQAEQGFCMQSHGGLPSGKVASLDDPSRTVKASPNEHLVQAFITVPNGAREGQAPRTHSLDAPSPVVAAADRLAVIQPEPLILSHCWGANNATPADRPAPTVMARQDKSPMQLLQPFLEPGQYNRPGKEVDQPASAVTADGHTPSLVQPQAFIAKGFSSHNNTRENAGASIDDPFPTISVQNRLAVIQPQGFLAQYMGGNDEYRVTDLEEPCKTVTTANRYGFVQPQGFLSTYHGSGDNATGIDQPSPSIPVADVTSLVQVPFLDNHYGSGVPSGVDEPAHALTANQKQKLVQPFVVRQFTGSEPVPASEPAPSITTSNGHQVAQPVEGYESPYWMEQETDTPSLRKVRRFCRENGIADVWMRMLSVRELLLIQGFPKDYILKGSQKDQKKFIGNAVHEVVPRKWAAALYGGCLDLNLIELEKAA